MINRLDKKYFIKAVGTSALGKDSDVDLTARCPVCGDSRKNKRTKRLHLYTKGSDLTLVNCFNGDCTVQNKTMYRFLRDHYPALLDNYKREQFGNTIEKLSKGESLDEFESAKSAIKENSSSSVNLTTIALEPLLLDLNSLESMEAKDYLKGRGIEYNESTISNFGKWYFCKVDLKIEDVIYKTENSVLIPLYINNKIYGFYSRKIKEKMFATYNHNNNIGYKVWNWFNINKETNCYIFEGIFDALSTGKNNIIAAMGAKIPLDRIKELKKPIFCLDNDKTGLLNSLEYAKMGYSIVIFPDNVKEKDYNELVQNNPNLNVDQFIFENTYTGLSAEIRIKEKL